VKNTICLWCFVHTTGREEFWNEPPGLSGIWMTRGYCDRCHPFNKCMGFLELSDQEWEDLEGMIDDSLDSSKIEGALGGKQFKKCVVA
jgi:hypothetical protein